MNLQNRLEPLINEKLGKRALVGAGIALILIAFFLYKAGEPSPEWPRFWIVRPLVIVPLAGAAGGIFFHIMDLWRMEGGWRKLLANIVSVLVYIIGFYLGFVLGMDGTYWD